MLTLRLLIACLIQISANAHIEVPVPPTRKPSSSSTLETSAVASSSAVSSSVSSSSTASSTSSATGVPTTSPAVSSSAQISSVSSASTSGATSVVYAVTSVASSSKLTGTVTISDATSVKAPGTLAKPTTSTAPLDDNSCSSACNICGAFVQVLPQCAKDCLYTLKLVKLSDAALYKCCQNRVDYVARFEICIADSCSDSSDKYQAKAQIPFVETGCDQFISSVLPPQQYTYPSDNAYQKNQPAGSQPKSVDPVSGQGPKGNPSPAPAAKNIYASSAPEMISGGVCVIGMLMGVLAV
ncbi:hypothetical protein BJ741DRAFT_441413 [Chytriomyces cf. hyalinus JEL632]|nr:hypothetical protein BJ741DRAFT_441413 [Chytriomyces cf. hyalinus JEL632]